MCVTPPLTPDSSMTGPVKLSEYSPTNKKEWEYCECRLKNNTPLIVYNNPFIYYNAPWPI